MISLLRSNWATCACETKPKRQLLPRRFLCILEDRLFPAYCVNENVSRRKSCSEPAASDVSHTSHSNWTWLSTSRQDGHTHGRQNRPEKARGDTPRGCLVTSVSHLGQNGQWRRMSLSTLSIDQKDPSKKKPVSLVLLFSLLPQHRKTFVKINFRQQKRNICIFLFVRALWTGPWQWIHECFALAGEKLNSFPVYSESTKNESWLLNVTPTPWLLKISKVSQISGRLLLLESESADRSCGWSMVDGKWIPAMKNPCWQLVTVKMNDCWDYWRSWS